MEAIDTLIFDFDGTLYEDAGLYDRYAAELARLLPTAEQEPFLARWREAREGGGSVRIGHWYDDGGDSESRKFIGDWWALLAALAIQRGLPHEQRQAAFLATREYMHGAEWQLLPEPGLRDLLLNLKDRGRRLIAMSNSPEDSVRRVLERLHMTACFVEVLAGAGKPIGLERFLAKIGSGPQILSVGDHYVNDIEPALRVGCAGLYIDRHGTGLGAEYDLCHRVPSIAAACSWLLANVGSSEAG